MAWLCAPSERLFTRFDADAGEVANVVGCLCTPLDILADEVALPRAEIGELRVVAGELDGAQDLVPLPEEEAA